ncbi:hypothetical protein L1987_56657 [Smallanthus sonchifolius]|uniref:Uncharacterized protein n=1 Tax=Smallanthus sonchifolius TaxID=185202 RepID=A0ACB9ECZ5_9ASTR|nr:hypothetical protein L1987_56657 [Smallanthus sonchifolius]
MPAARKHAIHSFGKREDNIRRRSKQDMFADEAASVHFQFWNEECEAFQPGDIVRFSNGIFSYNRSDHLVLRAGKRVPFVESPNMSEILWVPDPNNSGKYIQESVISP